MRHGKNRGAGQRSVDEPGGGIARRPEAGHATRNAQRSEEGSGTLLSVGVIAAILSVCVALTVLLGVHVTRVRAQNGADMAALAGADLSRTSQWVAVGDQPCQQARAAAERNEVHLDLCEVVGVDVRVEVSAEFGPWRVRARARAGPENPSGVAGSAGGPPQPGSQPGPGGAGAP